MANLETPGDAHSGGEQPIAQGGQEQAVPSLAQQVGWGYDKVMNENRYGFESQVDFLRTRHRALEELDKFYARMGIVKEDVKLLEERLLLQFILACHLNIKYYQDKKESELRLQRRYLITSVALVALLPLAILGVTAFVSYELSNASDVVPLLTAVLTGGLGVHKAIGAWLEKRKSAGNFWQAAAELKNLLYTFEEDWAMRAQEWNPLTGNWDMKPEFLEALQEAIDKARLVEHKERSQFFQSYGHPPFDIINTLTTSKQEVESSLNAFADAAYVSHTAKSSEIKKTGHAAREKVKELTFRIGAYRKEILELQGKLAYLLPADPSRALLEKQLVDFQAKVATMERDLVEARIDADYYSK